MVFDSNRAWKEASAAIFANREVLLALVGVFFFLPSFAIIMLIKQPQMQAGASPEQLMAALKPFFFSLAPWFVLGFVIQALGQLTLFELLDRGRNSTVGEALRKGALSLPSYLVVQLTTGVILTIVMSLALVAGSIVSPVLGFALALYLVCQAYARFVSAGAVIVLERQLNPFKALGRAVLLTRNKGFRLGNFLFLLFVVFFVAYFALTILIGILAALSVGQGRMAEIVTGFFSSALAATAAAYFSAITVAIYRQLAGPSTAAVSATFE
ncbi:MAG TPA: hypothetical protein VHG29_12610 [Novosphingobium sp.]|nr:hypothetical protein [Novosphingobium sp.]